MSDDFSKEALELARIIKKTFKNKLTALAILSCVSDYEEDMLELLEYIKSKPNVTAKEIAFKAFDIDDNREDKISK